MSRLELKIPPVAVVLLAGLIMWLVAAALPSLAFPFPYQIVLALVFAAAGILVAVLGVGSFVRAGTTVDPTRPQGATSLVDDGIYRLTRNPMYLGFLALLVGWGVFLAHAVALAMIPLFVIYMDRFQIRPEERALLAKFGEDFSAYQRRVRRWL
jgi:protein-S-isoprenylcysteine O-methyltransferase Ste14